MARLYNLIGLESIVVPDVDGWRVRGLSRTSELTVDFVDACYFLSVASIELLLVRGRIVNDDNIAYVPHKSLWVFKIHNRVSPFKCLNSIDVIQVEADRRRIFVRRSTIFLPLFEHAMEQFR